MAKNARLKVVDKARAGKTGAAGGILSPLPVDIAFGAVVRALAGREYAAPAAKLAHRAAARSTLSPPGFEALGLYDLVADLPAQWIGQLRLR